MTSPILSSSLCWVDDAGVRSSHNDSDDEDEDDDDGGDDDHGREYVVFVAADHIAAGAGDQLVQMDEKP